MHQSRAMRVFAARSLCFICECGMIKELVTACLLHAFEGTHVASLDLNEAQSEGCSAPLLDAHSVAPVGYEILSLLLPRLLEEGHAQAPPQQPTAAGAAAPLSLSSPSVLYLIVVSFLNTQAMGASQVAAQWLQQLGEWAFQWQRLSSSPTCPLRMSSPP